MTDLPFVEQEITLLSLRPMPPIPIRAMVCGPFAYHRSPTGGSWAVTHVPTGCSLGYGYTEADAQRFIVLATATEGIDWQCSDVAYYDAPEQRAVTRRLIEAYRNS
jgi:hypothetical protein